jgi:hypothetical protein
VDSDPKDPKVVLEVVRKELLQELLPEQTQEIQELQEHLQELQEVEALAEVHQ